MFSVSTKEVTNKNKSFPIPYSSSNKSCRQRTERRNTENRKENRKETGHLVFQDDFTAYYFNSNMKPIGEHLEVEWKYCHDKRSGKN